MHMNGGRLQKSFSEHTAHETGLQQLQTPLSGTHSAENRKLRLRFTGSACLTPDVETWQHSDGRIRTWREREFLDHPALCQLLTAWGSTTSTQANTQQESPARVAVRPTNTPSSNTDTHGGCVNFSHSFQSEVTLMMVSWDFRSDWSPAGGDGSEDPGGDSRHFHKQMCLCWSLFKASTAFCARLFSSFKRLKEI